MAGRTSSRRDSAANGSGEPAADARPSVPATVATSTVDDSLLRYEDIPVELAEALRAIINRYELRNDSTLPATIAVTSAMRGEGVTTISQVLATVIAKELSQYVCWVDCSWMSADPQPTAASGRPGLIDILSDRANILSAFQTAPDVPQLFTLRAGPLPEAQRNMIARSPQFDSLLEVLSNEFDHVIFDVPPVLINSNALALLRRADESLFVVRHRATSITQFKRLSEATQPTPNFGVVLNQYRTSIPARIRRILGD